VLFKIGSISRPQLHPLFKGVCCLVLFKGVCCLVLFNLKLLK